MWRPAGSSPTAPSLAQVKLHVLAVGRLRPPYADDVQHYSRSSPATRGSTLIEVREDEQLERRIPERGYLVAPRRGRQFDLDGVRALARGAPPGGPRRLLRVGGPYGTTLDRSDHSALARRDDTPAPARARRPARAALPAHKILATSPTTTDVATSIEDLRRGGRRRAGLRNRAPRHVRSSARGRRSSATSRRTPRCCWRRRRRAPAGVADRLADGLRARLGPGLDAYEVAGPGFLNLFLADEWYTAAPPDRRRRHGWRRSRRDGRERHHRVRLREPDRPAHRRHARHAADGDGLARLLDWHGHEVGREFYVNDAGAQITKLGESIRARSRGEEPPEGGYHGEYVAELAADHPGSRRARRRGARPVEGGRWTARADQGDPARATG